MQRECREGAYLAIAASALVLASLMLGISAQGGPNDNDVQVVTRAQGEPCANVTLLNTSLELLTLNYTFRFSSAPPVWVELPPGQAFNLRFTVRNEETIADTFTLKAELREIPNGTSLLLNQSTTSAMPPGANVEGNITCNIPGNVLPGEYWIKISVEPENEYESIGESINVRVLEKPSMHMEITNSTAETDIGLDAEFEVRFTNSGNVDIVVEDISASMPPSMPQQWNCSIDGPDSTLNITESINVTLTMEVPVDITPAEYQFIVWGLFHPIDQPSGMGTTNNATLRITVSDIPFLRVGEISFEPEDPVSERTVKITATVHNPSQVDAIDALVLFYSMEGGVASQIGSNRSINVPSQGHTNVSVETTFDTGKRTIRVVVYPNQAMVGNYTSGELVRLTNETFLEVGFNPISFLFYGFIALMAFLGVVTFLAIKQYREGIGTASSIGITPIEEAKAEVDAPLPVAEQGPMPEPEVQASAPSKSSLKSIEAIETIPPPEKTITQSPTEPTMAPERTLDKGTPRYQRKTVGAIAGAEGKKPAKRAPKIPLNKMTVRIGAQEREMEFGRTYLVVEEGAPSATLDIFGQLCKSCSGVCYSKDNMDTLCARSKRLYAVKHKVTYRWFTEDADQSISRGGKYNISFGDLDKIETKILDEIVGATCVYIEVDSLLQTRIKNSPKEIKQFVNRLKTIVSDKRAIVLVFLTLNPQVEDQVEKLHRELAGAFVSEDVWTF